MIGLSYALTGAVVLHVLGAVLRAVATKEPLGVGLRSPGSALLALAVLHALSFGPAGAALGVALIGCAVLLRRAGDATGQGPGAGFPWVAFVVLALVVLARPWVPTQWDEFVWLAKARLESTGIGAGVRASLDPEMHLVPRGYPTLFPAAVGWLNLGHDSIEGHTIGASLLLLIAAGAALEAWASAFNHRGRAAKASAVLVLVTAPMVWVHARSTYVDLPLGLLSLALLGQLLSGAFEKTPRPPLLAVATAVVMAGFKDEGLTHVLAASVGALLLVRERRAAWRLLLPAVAASVGVVTWRVLAELHGINNVDHSINWPAWEFAPRLIQLLTLHAADVFSWGIFWAVALGVLLSRCEGTPARALRAMLAVDFLFVLLALLCGPEQVRVFAENGTLLNRLLMQSWPAAAVLVLSRLTPAPDRSTAA